MTIDSEAQCNIKINGLKPWIVPGNRNVFENCTVYIDPSGKYAVAEVFRKELYIAIVIESAADDLLVGKYVDHYSSFNDTPMLMTFSVDWSCIGFGFCKLRLWAPELANEHGGFFEHTAARFYFDWELYKSSYERINGVPCTRKNPNE